MVNSIYAYVHEIAQKKFGQEKLTALQLLYGYASIATMSDVTLYFYFHDKAQQEEIAQIRAVLAERGLDTELLKTAAPLLDKGAGTSEELMETERIEQAAGVQESAGYAAKVLRGLVELPIPELPMLTKGHTLGEVLAQSAAAEPAAAAENGRAKAPKVTAFLDRLGGGKTSVADPAEEKRGGAGVHTVDDGGQLALQGQEDGEGDAAADGGGKPSASVMDAFQGMVRGGRSGDKSRDRADEDAAGQRRQGEEEAPEPISSRERLQKLLRRSEQLYAYLNEKMPGQREAVHLFVQSYFQSEFLRAGDDEEKRPAASLLFAGSPTSGMRQFLNCASDFLKVPVLNVDYIRELTDVIAFLQQKPRCFILIDEVEMVKPELLAFFQQVMKGGITAKAKEGEEIDFTRATLVFTTYAGSRYYEDRSRRFAMTPVPAVLDALGMALEERHMQPVYIEELLSRFTAGNVLLFNQPDAESLSRAASDAIRHTSYEVTESYGFEVQTAPELESLLLYERNDTMSTEEIGTAAAALVKNEIYELGRHLGDAGAVLPDLKELRFVVDAGEDEQVRSLFEHKEDYQVLYLGDEGAMQEVRLPEGATLRCVADEEAALQAAAEAEVRCILLDPLYGVDEGQTYLSLDDRKSVGIRCFEQLSEKLPHVPAYFVTKDEVAPHDASVLLERGARGFLSLRDPIAVSEELRRALDMIILQKKVDELQSHSMTLRYNTSQELSVPDGDGDRTATIRFYDIRLVKSVQAEGAVADVERPTEKFADVIGAEDAKKELKFFINYMRNPKPFMMNSTQPPKGLLLYGPPGTGKTMLARAMAAESEATFFAVTGSSFSDKYVGESEKNIRNLFAQARSCAPSIIFIDEIDSIGRQRTGSESGRHEEKELNTLIAEMDGFHQDPTRPVFVIAATNYDVDGRNGSVRQLDDALTRRFARTIYVDLPKKAERVQFVKQQLAALSNSEVTEDAMQVLADRTPGESLAILKNVIDAASRNAMMAQAAIDNTMLLQALEEYKFGEAREWNEEIARATAIHESGHTYVSVLSGERPSYVTIVSRGNFGGYMAHEDREDKFDYSKEDLLWQIRVAMAGRAAELVFYDEEKGTNTGIASDLQQATRHALNMVCRYGMSGERLYSIDPSTALQTALAPAILEEVNALLQREMEATKRLVQEGKDKVEAMADFLCENNQATAEQIMDILGDMRGAGRK